MDLSHYVCSTGPTKKLDLDIMCKLHDGEQVTRSDVTKFARVRFQNVSDQQVFKVSFSHTTKTLPKPVGSRFLDNSSSHSWRNHVCSVFSCVTHESTVRHTTDLLKTVRFVCLTPTEQFCVSGDLYLYSYQDGENVGSRVGEYRTYLGIGWVCLYIFIYRERNRCYTVLVLEGWEIDINLVTSRGR